MQDHSDSASSPVLAPNPPSRVIHIRNVTPDVMQADLVTLASQFGRVVHCIVLRSKNQALVQMYDLQSATAFVQFYASVQPNVRGHRLYVQFSNHQELTSATTADGSAASQHNRVLLVTIYNPMFPITVEVLFQVFSPHGVIEKIVIFNKEAGLQALVQYQFVEQAIQAQSALQGCNIYAGCCTLSIQFSKLVDLTVRFNNERSRDFANPSLPEGPPDHGLTQIPSAPQQLQFQQMYAPQALSAQPMQLYMPQQQQQQHQHHQQQQHQQQQFPPSQAAPSIDRTVLLVSNLNTEAMQVERLFNLFSCYGNIVRVRVLRERPDLALVQYVDGASAGRAVQCLKGLVMFGKAMEVSYSKHAAVNPASESDGPFAREYGRSSQNRFLKQSAVRHMYEPTNVLHVANLSDQFTEEVASRAFGTYGQIVAMKIFESSGFRQCLVQFNTISEASEALVSAHGAAIVGSELRVSFSKSRI
eukprot:TRINITY_DN3229_c0_g3_i1.p1 TRINITY_DN3229_c0_g3~~TRINITY_DN3229_c0_g3_i1.p1  ORF type:complete len:473 (+),score=77.27 TRINITY_DN3229_c0_g3_i1:96-1514(+)